MQVSRIPLLLLIVWILSIPTPSSFGARKAKPIIDETNITDDTPLDSLSLVTSDTTDEPPATPLDSLSRQKTLQLRIDEWLNKKYINRAQWGIRVERMSDRTIVYDRFGEKPLIPASNMKLFSAAAAYEILGPDFRFRTAFVGTAPIDANGVLNGNLQIIGSGDPTLSRIFHDEDIGRLLGSWADTLVGKGLRRITGQIEVPPVFWAQAGPPPGWDWNDLAEDYCAFPDLVAINDNCFELVLDPGDSVGDTIRYSYEPDFLIGVDNGIQVEALTGEKQSKVKLSIIPAIWNDRWQVIGSIPLAAQSRRRRVTIRNPREVWRRTLENVLKARGVQFGNTKGKTRRMAGLDVEAADRPSELSPDTLWIVESLPLKRIASEVLKRSHNLSAEHLFRTVGYYETGEWSNESGKIAVTNLMRKWGLDSETFTINDGSGLGRASNVPPAVFTQLLREIAGKRWFNEFYEIMAQAGEPQTTMQKRHLLLPKGVTIKAKTGTLSKVTTLTGYITSPTDTLTFSMLCNYFYGNVRRVKETQNGILTELAWSLAPRGPRNPALTGESPAASFPNRKR